MSFGFGVGDFIALAGLAARVYTAYKHAPDDYSHISEELEVLQILIDKAAKHFKGTNISSDDRHYGQTVLKECHSVLENLHSFKPYKSLASTKSLIFTGIKIGKDLQESLITNTALLKGFVRRSVVRTITLH